MKTQLELLKEAVALAEANPEAGIHICAYSSELIDDYAWTKHQISSVELDWLYTNDDHIIVGVDNIRDCLDYPKDDDEPGATEAEAIAVSSLAILIYTDAS